MRKQFLKYFCLAMAACAFLMAGCQAENRDMPTLSGTESTIPTTSPQEKRDIPAAVQPDTVQPDAVQLRLYGRNPGWWQGFKNGNNYFFVAENAQNLRGKLTQCGLNPDKLELSQFDSSFFSSYVLAVIPRTSGSGSVRYQPRLSAGADCILITVDAQVPEIGTCDMADWLVMVPVPRKQLRSGMTIAVDPSGMPQGGPELATR